MICVFTETGGLGAGRVDVREDGRVLEDMEEFSGISGTCCPSLEGDIGRERGGDVPGEGCGDERRNAFRARTWRFVSSEAPPALIGLEKFKYLRWVSPTERDSAIGVDNTFPNP